MCIRVLKVFVFLFCYTFPMKYIVTRSFDLPFQDVVEKTLSSLQKEWFGVLQQTNLSEKIQNTLGKAMKKYELLMVCHPGFAYDIIHDDLDLGVFLPCTVIVYERDNDVVVSALQAKVLAEKMIENHKKDEIMEYIWNVIERAILTIA